MNHVVECISLSKVFNDFWGRAKVKAVDELDMHVQPKEIFGLLGPNGSGKSTTIKMLLGLLYPTRGVARVFGKLPTDTAIKARIGFMPEESYLYRYLNAYETLDYYGRLFKLDRVERRRRTEQLIDKVGLRNAAKRPVGTYSKGMARRIGLAQALVNDPDLLILDEPTSGLDPAGTLKVKNVIKELGERGKTVILCSHLLADVEDVCDRVLIMYGGKQQAVGQVNELLKRQDTTQIVADQLDEATLQQIRQIIEKSGKAVKKVDHPTDRLENLFFRVIADAQQKQLATSGAEDTADAPSFLSGDGAQQGEALVNALVDAGNTESDAAQATPAVAAPKPKADILSKLSKVDDDTADKSDDQDAVQQPATNQDVLGKLLKKKDGDD